MATDCKKKTKISIQRVLCAAARAGGEPAFNAYRDAHNTFIGILSGLANTAVAVLTPLLEIDKLVYSTFVKPPLDATLTLVDAMAKTIKIPMMMLGGMGGGMGECSKFGTGLTNTMNKATKRVTGPVTELHNHADELEAWIAGGGELIVELQALADIVGTWQITEDYNTFIDTICPTI